MINIHNEQLLYIEVQKCKACNALHNVQDIYKNQEYIKQES